ncbi:hypothetical protein TorRG33x02_128690 [Trema orientale]|uniref:Uncharacterized protein n=1 Tax=Trema orientale TaxID=63057 RepID=A0A2P5F0I5_TREOI|nr:hypothetical protein TorRG33x02_128690 [Trema orientale]
MENRSGICPGEMKVPKLLAFLIDFMSKELKHLGLAVMCSSKERRFTKIIIHRQEFRSQAQHFLGEPRHVGGGGLVKHRVSKRIPCHEHVTVVLDVVFDVVEDFSRNGFVPHIYGYVQKGVVGHCQGAGGRLSNSVVELFDFGLVSLHYAFVEELESLEITISGTY